MNSLCPSCGTEYAVATKDIGRRLKCKKCGTALRVGESGLVVDEAAATDEPAAAAPPPVPAPRRSAQGAGVAEWLAKIGGTPTLLFGLGVFFVLYFFFQNTLSVASANRAEGGYDRVKLEESIEIRKLREGKDLESLSPEARNEFEKDYTKKKRDIEKKYEKPLNEANDDKEYAKIGSKRSPLLDNFGLMVGFILLAFGCIAYMRSDTHLLIRIVGGVILTLMMMAVFAKFSGCRG